MTYNHLFDERMIYLSKIHNKEAKAILSDSLHSAIENDFSSLLKMPKTDDPIHVERVGESGHEYQVEITAQVNEEDEKSLMVTGMIADGYLSSYICLPPFIQDISVSRSGEILDATE